LKVDNSTASARPCSWCMQNLILKGVYRVVYTTDFRYPESFYISTVIWKDDIL
jgi:deoxycytidylate deaminase